MTKIYYSNKPKRFTIIDDEDAPRVNRYSWSVLEDGRAYTYIGSKITYLSRFIKGVKDPKQLVDHISGDHEDNRQCNLRLSSRSENGRNSKKRLGSLTSKYKGVSWYKPMNKWRAYINYNGLQIHLGYFESEIDAAKAYNLAALKYFGEFAKLNIIN